MQHDPAPLIAGLSEVAPALGELCPKGSGADYLMTRAGDDAEQFVRLEVSGTARGDALELRARMAQKRAQLREGRYARPGVAVVVAFADAIIRMEDA